MAVWGHQGDTDLNAKQKTGLTQVYHVTSSTYLLGPCIVWALLNEGRNGVAGKRRILRRCSV